MQFTQQIDKLEECLAAAERRNKIELRQMQTTKA